MLLSQILQPENIKVSLDAINKTDAIKELVTLMAGHHDIIDIQKVLEAVLDREAVRTTGIGNGLAIPHCKCSGATDLVIALGKARTLIDFQSIDGGPVTLIWLLVSPQDKPGPHIHALARISRLITLETFRAAMANATTAQEMYDVIAQQESGI